MTPTFGELAEAAEIHLSLARRYPASTLSHRELAVAAGELRTCVETVVRLADTSRRDGRELHDPEPGWQQRLADLHGHLHNAAAQAEMLSARATGKDSDLPPARRLADAAVAVGAAIDLLSTHFDVGPEGIGYRDEYGAYLDSVEGRRDIATQVGRFAASLSPIARDIALALHAHDGKRAVARAEALLDVSEHLRAAATQPPRADANAPLVLSAVPALDRLRPTAMTPTRDVGIGLDRAVDCAERLHRLAVVDLTSRSTPTTDPAALAGAASAIASSQAMAARCLHHLERRAEQVAPALTAQRVVREMRASADAAEHAYERWVDVRDGLRGGRGLITRGLGIATRSEANKLLLVAGRLLHADPRWEPHVGGDNELRPAGELVPDRRALSDFFAGLHRLEIAQALTANRQASLVRSMAAGGVFMLPTRSLPESDDLRGVYTPMPDDEARALVKRYVAARDATAEAARRISVVPQLLGCLRPDAAAQVELTRWRLPDAWRDQPTLRSDSRAEMAVAL
jgi:hypothetical protein